MFNTITSTNILYYIVAHWLHSNEIWKPEVVQNEEPFRAPHCHLECGVLFSHFQLSRIICSAPLKSPNSHMYWTSPGESCWYFGHMTALFTWIFSQDGLSGLTGQVMLLESPPPVATSPPNKEKCDGLFCWFWSLFSYSSKISHAEILLSLGHFY